MKELGDVLLGHILSDVVPDGMLPDVLAAFRENPSVSVRVNPSKPPVPVWPGAVPVPWNPLGFMLPERPSFTFDPLFHAGTYYVQDSSAMFVGEVFRQVLNRFRDTARPLRVLDLCAAPGGKSTDIAASLRQAFGDSFLLVCNEPVERRCRILKDNMEVWGEPSCIVTCSDPTAFAKFEGFFDIIVADVPCSGEGMFRKDEGAVSDWSEENVALCAARQKRIVSSVWPALAEGGVMIYSTCTFNNKENGGNVDFIAGTLGAEIISPLPDYPGVLRSGGGYSLVPGLVKGEGQFCAALVKTSSSGRPPKCPKAASETVPQNVRSIFRDGISLRMKGTSVVAVSASVAQEAALFDGLRPLSSGIIAGDVKGRDFVPSAALALSGVLAEGVFPETELTEEEAIAFLRKDSLMLPEAPLGYNIVTFKGHPLGFVKNLGNRINNLHPSQRRIRSLREGYDY